jgi:mono/diheme cytochrome c family protein
MTSTTVSRSGTALRAAWLACLLASLPVAAADVDAGRRMYREGLLPDGQPLTAIVTGDVEILGTQFSCVSCHGRSGMGASEGAYIVPPIAGQFLFAESPQPPRPAYTSDSLVRLLRDGVTPTGRSLGDLMPRYKLRDADAAALVAYLRTLSAGNSPGVDASAIHFATVVTEDVDPALRRAVNAVLQQFAEEINRKTRNEAERWDRGYTPESKLPTVFREWQIDEWVLTGPSAGWTAQLERRYAKAPVFAMLSGLGTGSWGPVARFCEKHEVPCLYPSTDLPEAEEGDFYTVYFSRGLALEADLVASHLAARPAGRVVQVYCDPAAALAAGRLAAQLQERKVQVEDVRFDCGSPAPAAAIERAMRGGGESAAVLWLGRKHLEQVRSLLPKGRVYVSSTLMGEQVPDGLAGAAGPVFLVHPFILPGTPDPAMRRFSAWAKTRGIEVTHPRQQAEAFFACLVLNDAVKHIGRFFVREFALDMLDHAQGLMAYVPLHPRPTIGPGQRFISKGGYLVPIVEGRPDVKSATWIIP